MPKPFKHDWDLVYKFVEENFASMSIKDMAKTLGITYGTLHTFIIKQTNLRKFSRNEWTVKQDDFLRRRYSIKGGPYCSRVLDISLTAVNKRATMLGLHYIPKNRFINTEGYVMLIDPITKEQRAEHRIVMEQILGRKLLATELVHHIDGNKKNNHPDNLELTTRKNHPSMHKRKRQVKI